jgi:hypothetical protein
MTSVLISLITFLFPSVVLAKEPDNEYHFPDLIACNDSASCIPLVVNRLITVTLSLVGALFFVMFLWGGFQYLTAGDANEKVKKAIETLKNAVIGLLLIATSYVIVTKLAEILSP